MAFDRAGKIEPVSIGGLEVSMYRADPGKPGDVSTVHYNVKVRYNNGAVLELTGNLVPHLTATQINSLIAFMDTMYAKAQAEILPQ